MNKKAIREDYDEWEKVYQFLNIKFGDKFGGYLDVGQFKGVAITPAPSGQVSVELKVNLDSFNTLIAAIEKVSVEPPEVKQ